MTDKDLSPAAITISYSPTKMGPWKPIEAKLANKDKYIWHVPRDLPAEVYIRVDAEDLAGNVAAIVTADPVVDTKVPIIRIKSLKQHIEP